MLQIFGSEPGMVSTEKGQKNMYVSIEGGIGLGMGLNFPILLGERKSNEVSSEGTFLTFENELSAEYKLITPYGSIEKGYDNGNNVKVFSKEIGLGASVDAGWSGKVTLIFPNSDQIGEMIYNTEQGREFFEDMKKDLDLKFIN